MLRWIDTHCHLDAPELTRSGAQAWAQMRLHAASLGVGSCVLPAVMAANFDSVRACAHTRYGVHETNRINDAYALGLHPLYMREAVESDLEQLATQLTAYRDDPRLVAVGEIGLDFFVPELCAEPLRQKQEDFYLAQLRLAKHHDLPVILHVRRSADRLLKHLRDEARDGYQWRGIAHAFNGSMVQAKAFLSLGFKLGFGGAATYDRALQLRRLAAELPLDALVLETDAPDIPPHWLYATAEQRLQGTAQGVNTPAELPRIAGVIAQLRGMSLEALAEATSRNAQVALPRLATLMASASRATLGAP